ncbi:hypothetical protein N0V94_004106 [Neodidymelliopsis sp. IMI 364377]|nr:hypothetical protein N0V94_004106 [Neodidymelliopsis sp. IMI 364377]
MAKKTKNQKLTEADKEHLEKCFQRVREQSLRQCLEEMLGDFDLGKRTEFGVSRDNLPTTVAETGNEELHKHDLRFKNALDINLPEHQDDTIGHKDTKEADTGRTPIPDPTDIWTQHALHMQERYRQSCVPHFAVVTKLPIQKKLFDRHVDQELQVREAAQITPIPDASFQPTRSGITTTWNPVLATAAFAEHSLWELTSSLLWRYFEGGLSWKNPH